MATRAWTVDEPTQTAVEDDATADGLGRLFYLSARLLTHATPTRGRPLRGCSSNCANSMEQGTWNSSSRSSERTTMPMTKMRKKNFCEEELRMMHGNAADPAT